MSMSLALCCLLSSPFALTCPGLQDGSPRDPGVATLVAVATGVDAKPEDRVSAARTLAEDPALRALPALVQMLGGRTEVDEQHRAILALVAMGRVVTLPVQEALASDDAVVRRNASAVLSVLGDPRATPSLLAVAATDPSDEVRGVAAGALGATTGSPAEAFLAWSQRYLENGEGSASSGPLWELRDGVLVATDVPDHLRAIKLGQKMARAAMRLVPESAPARAAYGRALLAEATALGSSGEVDAATKTRIAMLQTQALTLEGTPPASLEGARQPATAVAGVEMPVPAGNAPLHLQVARGAAILVRVSTPQSRSMSSIRFVQGSRSTVSAGLTGELGPWVGGSREVKITALDRSALGFYRVEGLDRLGRRSLFPISLEITSSTTSRCVAVPPLTDAGRQASALSRVGTIQLSMAKPVLSMRAYVDSRIPIDPILYLGMTGQDPGLGYFDPTKLKGAHDFKFVPGDVPVAYINAVIPEGPGRVNGTVELRGKALPCPANGDQIRVYLGRWSLEVLESKLTYVLAQLPDFETVGTLRVVQVSDGAEITAVEDYRVTSFRPFDHFDATATDYSKVNSYLLALASQRVYVNVDTDGTAPSPVETPGQYMSRLDNTFGAWGMTVTDVIHDGDFSNFFDPSGSDTQGVVMQNSQVLIVALAGTQTINPADVATDVGCIPYNDYAIGRSSVHHGFWLGQEAVTSTGITVFETIRSRAAQAGTRRVWITGHSLGGAMAHIVALRLRLKGVDVQGVITFGAPKTGVNTPPPNFSGLFDGNFNAGTTNRAWRLVSHGDPVPMYPLASYWQHCGSLGFFRDSKVLGAAQNYYFNPLNILTDHLEYWERVETDFRGTTLGATYGSLWPRVDPSPPQ